MPLVNIYIVKLKEWTYSTETMRKIRGHRHAQAEAVDKSDTNIVIKNPDTDKKKSNQA